MSPENIPKGLRSTAKGWRVAQTLVSEAQSSQSQSGLRIGCVVVIDQNHYGDTFLRTSARDSKEYPFQIDNHWFSGKANLVSFEAEELFGTKLRALLQRHKNRDLFDMQEGLKQLNMDLDKLIAVFEHYLAVQDSPISRAEAEMVMLSCNFRNYPSPDLQR